MSIPPSGGGVSAAFDHVGGGHLRKVSLPSLRDAGTAVLYGGYNATIGGRVHPWALVDLLLNGRISAWNLFGQSKSVVTYSAPLWRNARPAVYRQDLAAILQLVGSGKLQPLVGATFPLSRAADAHRTLEERAVAGKIVLVP